ncbi:conserved hypothetical protein [Ricinus communis]|uniref:Uncharacterized protein n=1 Tax=Ricinus communis TaxID=3988 RepID=B9RIY6_RICCO|nr:conserved hypothetical protein [Ricinus communis]
MLEVGPELNCLVLPESHLKSKVKGGAGGAGVLPPFPGAIPLLVAFQCLVWEVTTSTAQFAT